MSLIMGRNSGAATPALAGTWVAFVAALALALPQPPRPAYLLAGAVAGGALILTGFAAASRCRALPEGERPGRAATAAMSLLSGAALGLVLLAVLLALVNAEPALRARFAGRLGEPFWRPWALAFESSILEEVVFRLFVLSALAWLTSRLFPGTRRSFAVGLVGSALLFALAHLPAWLAAAHASPLLVLGVVALNGTGGLLFGYVFWRWGLPYAICCHFAADLVVQVIGPHLLGG